MKLILFLAVLSHQSPVSYSDLQVNGQQITYTLRLLAGTFAAADVNLDRRLDAQELAHADDYFRKRIVIRDCELVNVTLPSEAVAYDALLQITLHYTCAEPPRTLHIDLQLGATFDNYLQAHLGDNVVQEVLSDSHHEVDLVLKKPHFFNFLGLGIEHILTGYDHLLFLLTLILVPLSFAAFVKIITAFTIAHSLTLALAALQIFTLPSRWVESAIALSIAYVALENLLKWDTRHRWMVTFAFGLIHGFGFASVLTEWGLPRDNLALSLVGFNSGVEIGQLVVVAIMFPLLKRLRKLHERSIDVVSALALACGLVWFALRVYG